MQWYRRKERGTIISDDKAQSNSFRLTDEYAAGADFSNRFFGSIANLDHERVRINDHIDTLTANSRRDFNESLRYPVINSRGHETDSFACLHNPFLQRFFVQR